MKFENGKIVLDDFLLSLQKKGVVFENIFNVVVDKLAKIQKGAVIGNGVKISGKSIIKSGAKVLDGSVIQNSKIGKNALVQSSYVLDSEVGDETTVGPFAKIRANSKIKKNCRIGNFVEVKNSQIGDGSKCAHLTYIGDATVGQNCNFGCGSITINYDGVKKFKTTIGNNVFIGSNANIIAPVKLADNSFVCAGTTITKNLDKYDFAIGRPFATIKKGYAKIYFKKRGINR